MSEQVYSTMTGLKRFSFVGQLLFRPWKIGSIVKMASKTGFYPRNKLKTQNLQPTLSVCHKAVMWSSCIWSHGSPFWLSVQRLIGDNGPMRFCFWLKGVEACQQFKSGLSSSQLLASWSQQWALLFGIQNKEHLSREVVRGCHVGYQAVRVSFLAFRAQSHCPWEEYLSNHSQTNAESGLLRWPKISLSSRFPRFTSGHIHNLRWKQSICPRSFTVSLSWSIVFVASWHPPFSTKSLYFDVCYRAFI